MMVQPDTWPFTAPSQATMPFVNRSVWPLSQSMVVLVMVNSPARASKAARLNFSTVRFSATILAFAELLGILNTPAPVTVEAVSPKPVSLAFFMVSVPFVTSKFTLASSLLPVMVKPAPSMVTSLLDGYFLSQSGILQQGHCTIFFYIFNCLCQ